MTVKKKLVNTKNSYVKSPFVKALGEIGNSVISFSFMI